MVMAGVLLAIIVGVVLGMRLFLDEAMTPQRPLSELSLSPEPQSFTVEVPEPGELVLWVEVALTSHRAEGWTGSPPFGPTVVVTRDGQTERCDTRDVLAFATLTKSATEVSWFGPLEGCRAASEGGRAELRAHYEPRSDPDEDFTVESVTVTVDLAQ